MFTLFGTTVSSKSNLQPVVALSATEAKYISFTKAVKEALWLQGIIMELGLQHDKVIVYFDNQSALHIAKHQIFYERSKHIDVKLHFVRDILGEPKPSSFNWVEILGFPGK